MKVLIAGGTGYIGQALTRRLLERGDEVTLLSRAPATAAVRPGVQVVKWDARSAAGWVEHMEQADVVINLAGENLGGGIWTRARKERILSSRLNTGRAIATAMRQASRRPRAMVQVSGIGYYGFSGERELDESSPRGDDFLARVSEQWEDASRAVEDLGVRRVVTRNGLVLHEREGIFPLVLLPYRLFVGGPLGSGRQWFPWVHIQDAVEAFLFLLGNEQASGVYNLVAPVLARNEEVGRAIARVMKRPHWLRVPGWAMRLALGELSTLVLEGQRAQPRRLLEAGYAFRYPDIGSALEEMLGR